MKIEQIKIKLKSGNTLTVEPYNKKMNFYNTASFEDVEEATSYIDDINELVE